jgi:hypothetical protein
MRKDEYDRLQELMSNHLHDTPYSHNGGSNKAAIYKEGVLACKSILKNAYEKQQKVTHEHL